MKQQKNPNWWTDEHDSAWERAKEAFRRDWDQTKHDFGGDEPDTDQQLTDTVKQAAGKESIPPRHQPAYEEVESAYRFGYGARSYYGNTYRDWNDDLEARLRNDWESTGGRREDWARDREAIRHAWEFELDEEEDLHPHQH